jgi:hypothetical protein
VCLVEHRDSIKTCYYVYDKKKLVLLTCAFYQTTKTAWQMRTTLILVLIVAVVTNTVPYNKDENSQNISTSNRMIWSLRRNGLWWINFTIPTNIIKVRFLFLHGTDIYYSHRNYFQGRDRFQIVIPKKTSVLRIIFQK